MALPVNFRPASLTSHLIKTLERIVSLSLVRYLELNMKMNPNQPGITGTLAKWIHSFFTNRKQFVLVNGAISEVSMVKSGVPQGTVLGPILFLILINDIDQDVSSKVSHLMTHG